MLGHGRSIIAPSASGKVDMKTNVLKEKPESSSTDFALAFDIGKFDGADHLRNVMNQLQSLLCAA